MRKKMLASAAALMMAVVMATSAFAATASVTLSGGTNVGVEVDGATDVDVVDIKYEEAGAVSQATVNDGGAAVLKAAALTETDYTTIQQHLDSAFGTDKKTVSDLTVVAAVMNIEGQLTSAAGTPVTLTVEGLAEGAAYVILHCYDNQGAATWEVVGAGKVGAGGTILGQFRSFSPVIVLTEASAPTTPTTPTNPAPATEEDDSSSSYTPAAQTTTAAAPVLAPQTGVNSAEALAAVVAVAGAAVAAFAVKKIKE